LKKREYILFIIFLFLTTLNAKETEKFWIFFKDKGPVSLGKSSLSLARKTLSQRSIKRRRKQSGPLVDFSDIPIYKNFIDELAFLNVHPINQSKWLNGISAHLSAEQVETIRLLDFVRKVRPVLKTNRHPIPKNGAFAKPNVSNGGNGFYDYGPSFAQNELCNIPQVHEMGITGQGVLIAVFDTGFRLNHEAFQHLNVISKYDFIHKDTDVDYDPEQDLSSQISHGTSVLSTLAGFSQGNLIGPAFNANFLLAKTENMSSETPAEEDFWIAAAEWADSIGADIISSSVGYLDWYSYKDMDGNTAPITIAADLAVKKGIIVVNAAGNEADDAWKYIIAPADGDSVITAGAVNSKQMLAGFSSLGPTFDRRIKPDVVAMGVSTRAVSPPSSEELGTTYRGFSGTSFSTPIVSGVAALVLSAFPNLTAMQVREALIGTADRYNNPDNSYGYGLVNALAAIYFWGKPPSLPEKHKLSGNYPNPYSAEKSGYTIIQYELAEETSIQIKIFNILGQKIATIAEGIRPAGPAQRAIWDGTDDFGMVVPSGIYIISAKLGGEVFIKKMSLVK
jgi:serine protease AprX